MNLNEFRKQHFCFEIITKEQRFHTYTSNRTCKKFIDSQEGGGAAMLAGQLANCGLINVVQGMCAKMYV